MRTGKVLLVMVAVLAMAGAAGAQNLVVNGGFEEPIVTQSLGWDIFASGTPGLGWTVEWAGEFEGAPTPAYLELHRGVNSWPHAEGAQHAELDTDWQGPGGSNGEKASVRIYQDLQTCPGRIYELSFSYAPRPDIGVYSEIKVYWDGTLVGTYSGTGAGTVQWTPVFPIAVTASDAGTTRLAFIETGTPDSLGMFLDAVSVPEIDCSCETDLIAGGGGDGGETVGSVVTVDNLDNTWAVTYNTNQDWELTELHLHLACNPEDLPQNKNNNPTIGHFAYTAYPEPGTHTFTFPDDVEGLEEVFPLAGDFKDGFSEDSCTCVYFAAHSVVTNTGYCEQFTTFYGAEQYSGDLYSIDLNAGTATLLADIDGGFYGNQNYPNGVAWDADNSRLYFTSESGGLYFWNGSEVITAGSLGGTVAGGTFYNGSYYYVLNGTDDLYEVTFYADGLVKANTKICQAFAGGTTMQFGDVVVDPAGPTLLGSADVFNRNPRPAFFSVALDGTCDYAAWTQPEKLQLAFGADGVLYGQSTGSGSFYSLDPANGTPTLIGEISTGVDEAVFHFTDLASDTRCVPPTETTETAWGDGTDFGGKSWATYFLCGACDEELACQE